MSERLTNSDGTLKNCEPTSCMEFDCSCKLISDALDKLAHYEELEKQERLIELPCRVGDTINAFRFSYKTGLYIISDIVTGVSYGKGKITVRTKSKFYPIKISEGTTIAPVSDAPVSDFPYALADFYIGSISEAEAKLKEMKENNE